MENPFVFGDVVKGDHFADREDELKTLTLDLSSGQNILLFSPRRYGKTSLIVRVMDQLKSKGFICVYVDFFPVTSLQSLGKVYANAIAQAGASKLEEAVQFIKDHFPTIIPKIVVKGGEAPAEFEIDFDAPRRDVGAWLDEIYDMPQKIAKKKGKKWVVVFDEFQEAATLGSEGTVERSLRAKIQHHDRVAYVFMGSKRHLLDEIFLDKTKPLYRIAKPMPLGKIPRNKLAAFIEDRFRSVHMKIAPEEVNKILSITDGHPYYTQQLCHEVYNTAVPRKDVKAPDITAACESCLKAQSYAYTTIWESLAAKQRDIVVALSKAATENIYSQDFIARFNLGSSAGVQRAMSALLKKGLVEKENGHYTLSDVFFVEWLKRKMG